MWDGNVPLHEWKYPLKDRPEWMVDEWGMLTKDKEEPVQDLITWVFEEGTFKPSAKIIDGEQFSIITDYLGTSVEMYNAQGARTWAVEYDIYGKVRKLVEGNADDCPFRYQGQYEDAETGLFYNRFRYYSADEGVYLSQDPIGLSSGEPNFYAYVGDSNSWIDPFGLSSISGTGQVWEVGAHEVMKVKGAGLPLDSHHVGQKAVMKNFVPNYDLEKAPAILVPSEGHTRKKPGKGIVSRKTKGFNSARDLLARDIREIRRVYPDAPNSKLKELIDLNKKMYPDAFDKKNIKCN